MSQATPLAVKSWDSDPDLRLPIYHAPPTLGGLASPQIHNHLEPQNVTLLRNRAFVDIVWLRGGPTG